MLNLTVRNVGQGDCIVLKWKNDAGEEEMGIIDCKDHDMGPLLDEIVKVKMIRFILLTHPHDDHYSGLSDLLDYCYNPEQAIKVGTIYHTVAFNPNYLTRAINYPKERTKFSNLLHKFDHIHRSPDNNTTCKFMVAGVSFNLSAQLKITCLAPAIDKELNTFITGEVKDKNRLRVNNPHGNYLSTILSISSPNWEILLTSDALNTTFERLGAEDMPASAGRKRIVLGQVPHHGSLQGHAPLFWASRLNRENTHTFISSNLENNLKHPPCEVIKFFHHSSRLSFTNYVEGIEDCGQEELPIETELGVEILDFISEKKVTPLAHSKDIRFSIDETGRVTCD